MFIRVHLIMPSQFRPRGVVLNLHVQEAVVPFVWAALSIIFSLDPLVSYRFHVGVFGSLLLLDVSWLLLGVPLFQNGGIPLSSNL